MIRKELIDYTSSKTKINNKSLIEKGILLHKILSQLTSNEYFLKNYAFKGGTCLMMVSHLPRFSEDLDFLAPFEEKFPITDVIHTVKTYLSNFGIKNEVDKEHYTEVGGSFRIRAKGPLFESEKSLCFLKLDFRCSTIFWFPNTEV